MINQCTTTCLQRGRQFSEEKKKIGAQLLHRKQVSSKPGANIFKIC